MSTSPLQDRGRKRSATETADGTGETMRMREFATRHQMAWRPILPPTKTPQQDEGEKLSFADACLMPVSVAHRIRVAEHVWDKITHNYSLAQVINIYEYGVRLTRLIDPTERPDGKQPGLLTTEPPSTETTQSKKGNCDALVRGARLKQLAYFTAGFIGENKTVVPSYGGVKLDKNVFYRMSYLYLPRRSNDDQHHERDVKNLCRSYRSDLTTKIRAACGKIFMTLLAEMDERDIEISGSNVLEDLHTEVSRKRFPPSSEAMKTFVKDVFDYGMAGHRSMYNGSYKDISINDVYGDIFTTFGEMRKPPRRTFELILKTICATGRPGCKIMAMKDMAVHLTTAIIQSAVTPYT